MTRVIFCERAKTVRMKSWGSVVAELTFLNKPWDLSPDRHSSGTFTPERLPLPLDTESPNKKHIFSDRASVSSLSCLALPLLSACNAWFYPLTCSTTHHRHLSYPPTLFCSFWYHLPVKSWKWKDRVWSGTLNELVSIEWSLLAQRAVTWLMGTHWGGDRLESWPDNSFLLVLVN